MSKNKTEFELAEQSLIDERTAHRVNAIKLAVKHQQRLERELSKVKALLDKAIKGEFSAIVEKYISTQVAEDFE